MSATGTGIFRTNPDDEDEYGVDIDLVTMTMQASQSPVLVRRDPTQTWWVIIQGPPSIFHAHQIDPVVAALAGCPTPWHAAIEVADEHAAAWRTRGQVERSDLAGLIKSAEALMRMMERGED